MATQPAITPSTSTGGADNQQLDLAESSMDTNPANEGDQQPNPPPNPCTSPSSGSSSATPSEPRVPRSLAGRPKPHTDHPTVSQWSNPSACQMYTECTKAAESYWWRSGCNRACDTVLGVVSICSCVGSLAAKLLPADTTALAECKHVLLPLSVVSLTVWYLGDWSTAAKKQLELHNKFRVLARRAKNIEVDLDNTDGISRDATSCAMSSPLQLTLKVLCDCGRCSTAEARQKEWDSIVRERTNLEGAATAPPCPWSHHPSSPEKNGILTQLVQRAPWIVVGAAAGALAWYLKYC